MKERRSPSNRNRPDSGISKPLRRWTWAIATACGVLPLAAAAQTLNDANLEFRTIASGLDQPIGMAFLGQDDLLLIEKASGKVKHLVNGVVVGTPLDLGVNSASERGLLSITLHPNFPLNPRVYLYWTESSTGADTIDLGAVPLLGNRVDSFVWNGSTLTFEKNIIKLHSYQADAGQPLRGNHNGGPIRFGPDGKLYVIIGDNGRRGWLQNNKLGPSPDDQFGGPFPDETHATGCIYRLNDDGSTPIDNPFVPAHISPSVDKMFAYGVRNSFGMDFDPITGTLWEQENGGNSFDEVNRIEPGHNGGWIQIMGPISRINDYKAVETEIPGGLQQLRWPVANIAETPALAQRRMYVIPGSHYGDPEFSWKYALAPAGLGFVRGIGLGASYYGDLIVGAARTTLLNGYLFRFKLTPDRRHFSFSDTRLADRVADNTAKFSPVESEELIMGSGFGVVTDVQTSPQSTIYLASLDQGKLFEIRQKPALKSGTPTQRKGGDR